MRKTLFSLTVLLFLGCPDQENGSISGLDITSDVFPDTEMEVTDDLQDATDHPVDTVSDTQPPDEPDTFPGGEDLDDLNTDQAGDMRNRDEPDLTFDLGSADEPDMVADAGSADEPDMVADAGSADEPEVVSDIAPPIDPELEPAGDYTESGPWTPGQRWNEITGSFGDTLYISTWFPSSESGSAQTWYGWDGWWNPGESYSDVSPACEETRPVMVHSHGDSSLSWEMYYLMEFLATHGWITIAPDHAGNTSYDGSASFGTIKVRRPFDIQDTYNWLLDENEDPESPYYGCIDPDAGYVMSGYSFGGYTAYANGGALVNDGSGLPVLDLSDDRVQSIITFAPWDAFFALTTGTEEIQVPVMTIGGERDLTVGMQYLSLHSYIESTPRILGNMPNGGHFSFTPIYCPFFFSDGCGLGYFEVDIVTELLKISVISWLEYLRGRSGALEQISSYPDELSWTLVE